MPVEKERGVTRVSIDPDPSDTTRDISRVHALLDFKVASTSPMQERVIVDVLRAVTFKELRKRNVQMADGTSLRVALTDQRWFIGRYLLLEGQAIYELLE